ncbi:MAG: response regulator, partial [Candidatus Methanofastidiosa archaeon]|nr:response regulator [Candidatus Methanofastidiosa archaeon]
MLSILYVDDEDGFRELTKLYLERAGDVCVDTAASAREALALLREQGYDAVVSDYQMPHMDGVAFLRTLRASGSTTPFILFTGKGREEVVIKAYESGADFYLQKGGEPRSQ